MHFDLQRLPPRFPSRGVCLGGARLGNRTLKRAETRICRMSRKKYTPPSTFFPSSDFDHRTDLVEKTRDFALTVIQAARNTGTACRLHFASGLPDCRGVRQGFGERRTRSVHEEVCDRRGRNGAGHGRARLEPQRQTHICPIRANCRSLLVAGSAAPLPLPAAPLGFDGARLRMSQPHSVAVRATASASLSMARRLRTASYSRPR